MIKNKLIIICFISLLLGNTDNQLNAAEKKEYLIDKALEISKAEAIDIAQRHMTEGGFDKKYYLNRPRVKKDIWYLYKNGDIGWAKPNNGEEIIEVPVWSVAFRSTTLLQTKPIYVVISRETGKLVRKKMESY